MTVLRRNLKKLQYFIKFVCLNILKTLITTGYVNITQLNTNGGLYTSIGLGIMDTYTGKIVISETCIIISIPLQYNIIPTEFRSLTVEIFSFFSV